MRTKQIIFIVKVPNQELEGVLPGNKSPYLFLLPHPKHNKVFPPFLFLLQTLIPPPLQFCLIFTGNLASFVWDFIGMLIRERSFLPGTEGLKELSQILWSVQLHLRACQLLLWAKQNKASQPGEGKQQGPETHGETAGGLLMSLHKHPYCVTSWCFRHWPPVWVSLAHSSFASQGPVFPAIVEKSTPSCL